MSWLHPSEKESDYIKELKQRDKDGDVLYYRLVRVLSLALRIEPLLLRNARLRFTPSADIDFETTLWFSDLMQTRNAQACSMRGGFARALTDDLAQHPEDFETAWKYILEHTRHWSAQDQLEQELRLAARNEDTTALQNGFNRILKTLMITPDADTKRDLSRWIKGAMPSLLKTDETSETAHLLFQYTAAALGLPSSWSHENDENKASMPQWLIDALPQNNPNTLGIQLRKGVLECLQPDSARHTLKLNLPLPTPVLLTINDNRQGYWESLWIGKKIPLYKRIKSLSLQTLDGKIHRFSVEARTSDEIEVEENPPASVLLAYMPNEFELAQQIAKMLRQNAIEVELSEDRAPQYPSFIVADRPVLRLWSQASSAYWQKNKLDASDAMEQNQVPGLLLRTDPIVELPAGANLPQSFKHIDWKKPDEVRNVERLIAQVLQWLKTGELETQPTENQNSDLLIQALLRELKNPETKPRRRLEIGDLLAELGDPRKGVGVTEYEIIDNPPETQDLLNELDDIKTEPPRRLEIGNRLAELGDPRPGIGLNDNGLPDIDWVIIPAGTFIYGEIGASIDSTGHLYYFNGEKTIGLPFYISRYPVTNRQYQAFIDAGGYRDERWWQDLIKPGPEKPKWKHANRPRETVNWYEAVAFTRWLSAQSAYAIALPTEQQWEKAARGTDARDYPWGSEFQSGYANINEKAKKTGPYYLQETSAAGIYPQGLSPYGVADMAGNVWEWCLNQYDKPEQIEPDLRGKSRVLRGGSWNDNPGGARSAFRYRYNSDDRNDNIGFRVVSSSPFTER